MTTAKSTAAAAEELDLFGEPVAQSSKPSSSNASPETKSAAAPASSSAKKTSTAKSKPKSTVKTSAQKATAVNDYPAVPEKRYFTISEAGDLCGVKPHVLRYWESEFKQLSPVKRAGNRRYYQRQDIFLIREIRELLHEQGFTIAGAKQKISGENSKEEVSKNKQILREVRRELEGLLKALKS